MKRVALIAGLLLLPVGWALSGMGMTGHMAGHMIAVAISAPLLAYGLSSGPLDAAHRWPIVVSPMAAMLLELVTVWSWHLPALRAAAHGSILVTGLEHACFLVAGLLLWTAAIHAPNRASGIGALLLTSMHMTLLGALVGLAPRPLYGAMHPAPGLDPLSDQQLGGVIMLVIGGVSYLVGGLILLAALLKDDRSEAA